MPFLFIEILFEFIGKILSATWLEDKYQFSLSIVLKFFSF